MSNDYEIDSDADEENLRFDDAYPGATDAPHAIAPAPSVLAGLNLELTLRCGHINLSLSALQHLAPGSVLGISGVTPGHATLCHGERVVAHGELVEVDGHLGLHITRVVFDQ
ncbi:FliM/FliN family flagellar motor switch protein [Pseudomonas psychrophila]|uniref:FliM/FliN family flagellar motor switch protein n=1 Tax=Pseudomonas psychrophila TaxID=122355 RepID=UPI00031EE4DF|nr:FliM/FliN family flagellar motor switch protein [Pseudomonas psychrophila]